MSKHEVPGQDDTTLAVGAPGDNTITVPVATTHVWLTNLDSIQPVHYSVTNAPAWAADWAALSPSQRVLVKMVNANVYLRKRVFFRYAPFGQQRDDANYIPPEVKATVEIEPTNI